MTEHHPPQGPIADDPQHQAVLAWEREFVETALLPSIMGRAQFERLADDAAASEGLPAPVLEYGPADGNACLAVPDQNKILVHAWARAKVRLLHEIAHLSTWRGVCRGAQPHGPEFVSVAIGLYARFLDIPRGDLEAEARRRGIGYLPSLAPALAFHPAGG